MTQTKLQGNDHKVAGTQVNVSKAAEKRRKIIEKGLVYASEKGVTMKVEPPVLILENGKRTYAYYIRGINTFKDLKSSIDGLAE